MKKVKLSTLGSLIDRSKEVPQQKMIYTFPTSGWYRIAECAPNGGTGIISIVASHTLNTGLILMFVVGFNAPVVFKSLNTPTADNRIASGRILTKAGEKCFIEINYGTQAQIPHRYLLSNSENSNLINPIPGNIPAGYNDTGFAF